MRTFDESGIWHRERACDIGESLRALKTRLWARRADTHERAWRDRRKGTVPEFLRQPLKHDTHLIVAALADARGVEGDVQDKDAPRREIFLRRYLFTQEIRKRIGGKARGVRAVVVFERADEIFGGAVSIIENGRYLRFEQIVRCGEQGNILESAPFRARSARTQRQNDIEHTIQKFPERMHDTIEFYETYGKTLHTLRG